MEPEETELEKYRALVNDACGILRKASDLLPPTAPMAVIYRPAGEDVSE